MGFPSGQCVSWTLKTDPGLEHNPMWTLWQPPPDISDGLLTSMTAPAPAQGPKRWRAPLPQLGEEGWGGGVNGDHPVSPREGEGVGEDVRESSVVRGGGHMPRTYPPIPPILSLSMKGWVAC